MIFISYRIADSNTYATWLERELKSVFGETAVFRDKTGIEGGDRWREVIQKHVTDCCAMLVLIGNGPATIDLSVLRYCEVVLYLVFSTLR